MKRLFTGILLLCLLLGFQAVFADGTCGTNVKYTISGNTISFSKSRAGSAAVWGPDCGEVFQENEKITSVKIKNKIRVKDAVRMFNFFENVEQMDLRNLDVSRVTDMSSMFNSCYELETLNLSGWDTSAVTDMTGMFSACFDLENLDMSGWNTSKVKRMDLMFDRCSSLENLDVSGWNTSGVIDMHGMFNGCKSLQVLDVSRWNTSRVRRMGEMFLNCFSLVGLDVSGWNVSKTEDMVRMFYGCRSLNGLDLSSWNTSAVTKMSGTFSGCGSLNVLVLGRNTLKKNIFKSLPKYNAAWYYIKPGPAAGNPLALKTVKANASLFKGYKFNTMAGTWSTKKNPAFASAITITNAKGNVITGKTVTSGKKIYQLKAAVTPLKAEQTVIWKSGNPAIALVSADGKVTFKKAGTVTIMAVSADVGRTSAVVKLKYAP